MLLLQIVLLVICNIISVSGHRSNQNTTYRNPILPGWHSDPSCVFVAEWDNTTFCTTSTFLAFPGIPVYASKDLINWKLASNVLNRVSQIPQIASSNNEQGYGVFASTIRFHEGRLYLINAYIDVQNPNSQFLIFTASDPYDDAAWSEPLLLYNNPFRSIDPDLFFDDDGKVVVAFAGSPPQASYLDMSTGNLTEPFDLWNGTGIGSDEGPHLFKKDGYYYLLYAEGGTQINHSAVFARSDNLNGPWEPLPSNPFLTNRDTNEYFQTVGHADLFQDAAGNWWGVALSTRGGPALYNAGIFPMGRETVLYPVSWPADEWPVAEQVRGLMSGPLPRTNLDVEGEGLFLNQEHEVVTFPPGSSLPERWVHWRAPAHPEAYTISPPTRLNSLRLTASQQNLTGDTNFQAVDGTTFIAERQTTTLFKFSADVELGFAVAAGDECGISSFLTQFQHVDLGILYQPQSQSAANASHSNLTPYFRFRATSFGKANLTNPDTMLTPVPAAWLQGDCSVRLSVLAVNESHFAFEAAQAASPREAVRLAVFSTALVSGDGAGSGGLLGVFATTNGGDHSMEAYISRWEYEPKAQEVDYGKFEYCRGRGRGCML